ncbi:SDR family oxidoreductase [Lentilactobacillus kribbianus]
MTKYAVTGAAGNLGKRVINELLNSNKASDITAAVHSLTKASSMTKL